MKPAYPDLGSESDKSSDVRIARTPAVPRVTSGRERLRAIAVAHFRESRASGGHSVQLNDPVTAARVATLLQPVGRST